MASPHLDPSQRSIIALASIALVLGLSLGHDPWAISDTAANWCFWGQIAGFSAAALALVVGIIAGLRLQDSRSPWLIDHYFDALILSRQVCAAGLCLGLAAASLGATIAKRTPPPPHPGRRSATRAPHTLMGPVPHPNPIPPRNFFPVPETSCSSLESPSCSVPMKIFTYEPRPVRPGLEIHPKRGKRSFR